MEFISRQCSTVSKHEMSVLSGQHALLLTATVANAVNRQRFSRYLQNLLTMLGNICKHSTFSSTVCTRLNCQIHYWR